MSQKGRGRRTVIRTSRSVEASQGTSAIDSAVLDATGALVIVLDRVGRIVRFNRTCESITGYHSSEALGKHFWDMFLISDEVKPAKAVFDDLSPDMFPNTYESHWRTKDGRLRLIYWTDVALLDGAGSVENVVATGIDITDLKHVEQELRRQLKESERHHMETAALLEGTSAALKYTTFNQSARALFDVCKHLVGAQAGYVALLTPDQSQNELVFLDPGGMDCTVDPSLPMPIRGLRAEVFHFQKTVYENEFPSSPWVEYLPEGHAQLENVLFAPLVIDGVTEGLMGLANKPGGFSDDDARLASAFADHAAIALHNSRLMESLRSSEERFRSVAETATDGIVCVDERGTVTFWNEAAETIFGYSAVEMLGESLGAVMPKRFRASHEKGMRRVVTTGRSKIIGRTVEVGGLRKDGTEFPLELSLSQWKTAEGVFFAGVIRDITDRKEVERLSDALNEINETVGSTLDSDEIMERVAVKGAEAIGADAAVVAIKTEEGWVVRHIQGIAQEIVGAVLTDEQVPYSVEAASSRKAITADDTLADARASTWIMRDYDVRSTLAVPLIVRDEATGSLLFYYLERPVRFTDAQVDFANKLAASVSLALENARLYEQEHRIAQTLQANLLRPRPDIPGLDIGIVYGSAYEAELVGGDFYDIFGVGENLVSVILGDVSGKGIKAAGLTETIRSSVRTLAYIDPSPAFVFNRLNQSLLSQLSSGYFATAILLLVDTATKEIRIASAGHPFPVICGSRCSFVDIAPGPLLGVFPASYRESYLRLGDPQSIVLYTDGLIEARRGNKLFGQNRLLKTVGANRSLEPQELADRLLEAAKDFAQGRLADDIAIVTLRLGGH